MDKSLRGVTVLVTRPLHQQQAFIKRLSALHANCASLPCLGIRWVDEQASTQLRHLEAGQILVFTSPNAVAGAHKLFPMPWFAQETSSGTAPEYTVLAIGPGTADVLARYSMPVSREPIEPYNSESLLALEELQDINLQKVSIIKGRGGRHYLADKLRKRTAETETIEVYERFKPIFEQKTLDSIFLKSALDIVTITSNEALQNLFDAVDKPLTERHKNCLLQLPLVVNSQRAAQLAKDLCFQSHVLVAPSAGDSGQLEAIKLWNSSYRFKL